MGSALSRLFTAGATTAEVAVQTGELTIYQGSPIEITPDVLNSGTDSGRLYWSCADGVIRYINGMSQGSADAAVQINLGERYS